MRRQGKKYDHLKLVKLIIAWSLMSLMVACGGGGSDTSTSGGSGGSGASGASGAGGGAGASGVAAGQAFVTNETGEINATLTASQPNYVDSSSLTLSTPSTVWAFTWAQYTTSFWAVDANNANLLKAGLAFVGYRLAPAGLDGMNFVNLPAGTWYVGAIPNQTITSSYSNPIYAELDAVSLPGATLAGNVALGTGVLNPGGWKTQPFTVPSASRTYIETEGPNGTFAVMTPAQATSFTSTFSAGFNGGTYGYTYACGPSSGSPTLEIECEMSLPAGNYVLVYINTSGAPSGGAANVAFYR